MIVKRVGVNCGISPSSHACDDLAVGPGRYRGDAAREPDVLPSPSWPSPFAPQHLSPPAVVTAQVCCSPADTEATPLVRPTTSTGAGSEYVKAPLPNWPFSFSPQQRNHLGGGFGASFVL